MGHILLALIALGTLGCTRSASQDNKTLVIGIESEVKNLDIRSTVDMNSTQVISLFTQSLVLINDQMLPDTDLALSFEVKEARIFDFKLPKDALFHDGQALSCEDVLASFKQAASQTSRIKSAFEDVKEFSCPAIDHFRIELKNPKASFLAGDVTAVRIMPKKYAESAAEAPPIGSGPYQFVKRENRDIVFKRFENFSQREKGGKVEHPFFFDQIIVRSVQDPTTRWLSLKSGDIDVLINALSPQKVLEAKKMSNLSVHQKPGNSFQYLGFNLRLPKFQNKKVRQAIAHAINRDEIIEHKLLGFARKATSVLSPLNYFHEKELKTYEYDPERAKALLKEAGFSELDIEIKISSDRDVTSIIMVIKEQLERVGLKVSLKPYEFATFFSDVQKGSFEMFSLRWVAVTEPDILFKIFHSKEIPPGRNRVYFNNKEIDKILEAASRESDAVQRKALYSQAQKIVAEELPYVPLWYPDNIAVTTSKLKDFELSSIGNWASILKARKE
jgi:peptide/nickel transport system substrate-binding protein